MHSIGRYGPTVYTVGAEVSVFEALGLMAQKNIEALVVVEHGQVVGMLTERDYARKVALMDRVSRDTPLRVIMTRPVMYVQPRVLSNEV